MERCLALQLCKISVFAVVAPGRAFDESQKMTQVLAFGGLKVGEFDPYTKGRTALGNNSGKDNALDPDFSIRQPEADLYIHSRRHRCSGFDEAPAEGGIGQIPPDGNV